MVCPEAFLGTHPGLVPGLSLLSAPVGDVLVLSFDLCNDAVHVQAAVVVHGQDDRGVRDLGLHLRQLLQSAQGLGELTRLGDAFSSLQMSMQTWERLQIVI